jgi:hypothetical protein
MNLFIKQKTQIVQLPSDGRRVLKYFFIYKVSFVNQPIQDYAEETKNTLQT